MEGNERRTYQDRARHPYPDACRRRSSRRRYHAQNRGIRTATRRKDKGHRSSTLAEKRVEKPPDASGLWTMTKSIRRYRSIFVIFAILIFLLRLVLSPTYVKSESMSEPRPIEEPNGDLGTPTQRLIEKLNDEKHIMREKVISE